MKTVGSLYKKAAHFCLQLQGVLGYFYSEKITLPSNSLDMFLLTPDVHWVITLRREQGVKGGTF